MYLYLGASVTEVLNRYTVKMKREKHEFGFVSLSLLCYTFLAESEGQTIEKVMCSGMKWSLPNYLLHAVENLKNIKFVYFKMSLSTLFPGNFIYCCPIHAF